MKIEGEIIENQYPVSFVGHIISSWYGCMGATSTLGVNDQGVTHARETIPSPTAMDPETVFKLIQEAKAGLHSGDLASFPVQFDKFKCACLRTRLSADHNFCNKICEDRKSQGPVI